jgi:uncharacterized membrane protein YdjX (TVP38/TMEM64 family)
LGNSLDPTSTWGIASPSVDTKDKPKPLITPFRCSFALLIVALIAGSAYLILDYRADLIDMAHRTTEFVRDQGPIPFFAGLAVLPAVGLPVSLFYLAAAAVFPLWISLIGTVVGLAINVSLCYWLARKWFRKGFERLMGRSRYRIPVVAAADLARLTLFLRLMPGPPFFLQSYILGMVEVPFATYFLISMGTQILIASGFIVLGSAFYSLSFGRALIAIVIVVLTVIIVQWIRRLLARRNQLSEEVGNAGH